MTRSRWTGLAGLLFGAGMFAMFFVGGSTPDSARADAPERYVKYWSDESHQTRAVVTAMIVSYLFLVLIAFVAGLHDRLRAVDGGPLPSFVRSAGTAAATLIAAGGITYAVTGLTAKNSSSFELDGSTALLLDSLGYGLVALGFMAAAAMAVVTGILTLRTRVLPVWTAWLGFLVGLGALGSYFTVWADFMVLPAWAVVIGIVLLMQPDGTSDAEPAVAA